MIDNIEIIIRLLLGAVFGGIIGFERHAHGRAAGFRTHLLSPERKESCDQRLIFPFRLGPYNLRDESFYG